MDQADAKQTKRLIVACADATGLDGPVSEHFGRCPAFGVVEVDGATIQSCRMVANPHAANHMPGVVPEFIAGLGGDVVVTGGMGPRAIAFFDARGIEVVTGAAGTVRAAVDAYVRGEGSGAGPCAQSHDHQHCHHPPEESGR